jgi:hypothetical protein
MRFSTDSRLPLQLDGDAAADVDVEVAEEAAADWARAGFGPEVIRKIQADAAIKAYRATPDFLNEAANGAYSLSAQTL